MGLVSWKWAQTRIPNLKAEDDYNKRCLEGLGFDKKICSFVFITPRDWAGDRDWEQEKAKDEKWLNVKVITATILADWIWHCPSVNSWLSNVMGTPADMSSTPFASAYIIVEV